MCGAGVRGAACGAPRAPCDVRGPTRGVRPAAPCGIVIDDMPRYPITSPEVLTFVLLPLLLAGLFGWATTVAWRRGGATAAGARRAGLLAVAAAAAWMAATWTAAAGGILLDWDATPPPFAFLVAAIVALAFAIGLGPIGGRLARHIPLWQLVAVQAFRLPLEIAMHRLAERGIMPDQMSYSGRNLDIVTGATAVVLAWLLWSGHAGRGATLIWNLLGLALLANIVTVAMLSTPRVAWFGADRLNVFVMHPPFVWLPAVLVLAALAGHLIVFRALRGQG